jgi:MFS family permease
MVCTSKPSILPLVTGERVIGYVRLGPRRDRDVVDALSWRFVVLISLMATAASAPFFLFTLPAGVIADVVNRRAVILSAILWQATCSALLALGAWTEAIGPISVLVCIFALGIGLAFGPRFGEPLSRTSLVRMNCPPRSRWEECN